MLYLAVEYNNNQLNSINIIGLGVCLTGITFHCILKVYALKSTIQNIYWVGKNFFGFSKFPGIVEKALEVSILTVYKGSSSIFRTTIKSWIWTLIASQK